MGLAGIAANYKAKGWRISVNQSGALIIVQPKEKGNKYFSLNGVTGRERDEIESL